MGGSGLRGNAQIHTAKLYVLEDEGKLVAPDRITLEFQDGAKWKTVPHQRMTPSKPTGHRANIIIFPEVKTARLRVSLKPHSGQPVGLSELEF